MIILLAFRKNWRVSLAIVTVIAVGVIPFFGRMQFGGGASMLDFSITDRSRILAIRNNLAVLAAHPLFGVGLGQVETCRGCGCHGVRAS